MAILLGIAKSLVISGTQKISTQLGPGVLTKSNTEKGGRLTDSVPMSTQR